MAWLMARESVRSFGANRGLQVAAALACYGFLSLMPLLLLLMSLLGLFLRSSEAVLDAVRNLTSDLFPSFSDTILGDLMTLSHDKVWGTISIVALFWSITPFAGAMRAAIRHTFRSERRLPLALGKLIDLCAVLALLGLFLFLIATRVYFAAAGDVPVLGRLFNWLAPMALTAGIVCFFYAVFAPVRLRLGELLAGAVTAAVLLGLIRPIFALILEHNPSYGYAFGSLKALFVLIVWVHYTFAILLFGAEVMANVRRRDALLLRGLFATPGQPAHELPPALANRFMRRLAPGEILFHQGDAGHDMFVVQSGAVLLTVDGHAVRTMNAGDYFGEMSMLLQAPRSATATAQGETELIAISESNFDMLLGENPKIVHAILREMAQRLKVTTARATLPPRDPPTA